MEETQKYKVAVIGGGPGGYVAAIRAAASGQPVVLIEANTLGGTCLNRGCIPTKALTANAAVLHKIRQAEDYGITVSNISIDYGRMKERKDKLVERIRKSLEGLVTAHKVKIVRGFAEFVSPRAVKVRGTEPVMIEAERFIIATGSEPRSIAAFPCDGKRIHDSTSLLEITALPKSIVIIGGGVIGCEFASLFAELGVAVTVVEALPTLLNNEAKAVITALSTAFQRQGIKVELNTPVLGIDTNSTGVTVHLAQGKSIEGEMALVAIGRKFNSDAIGLEKAGVYVDQKGAIVVNDRLETNVPGIYAIGDVTGKWLLAHVASHQGVVAAQNALGDSAVMRYNAVPNVVFTRPEIGTVGYSLEAAIAKGYRAKVGKFPFQALGKSLASLETEGFAQVVIDQETGQILGAQVVGYDAANLIAPMALAIQNELTVESITETVHAHPTVAEAWLEAALNAAGTPIHVPPSPGV